MPKFCLDANVFIEANNGPYSMDFNQSFWNFLDNQATAGTVYSSVMVYDELTVANNKLAAWVKTRKGPPLFVQPEEAVQKKFGPIADYVNDKYPSFNADSFLQGADPWIIAQAMQDGSTVVTHEVLVGPDSKKVKIPNICQQFGVNWDNTYNMIRSFGVTL